MNHFRYLIVIIFALYNPSSATAKTIKSTASDAETKIGECDDTSIPDPVAQFESLPVHVKLAKQVTGYNQPSRAICQSKQLKYTATRENERIKVVSIYNQNGHPHATYMVAKNHQTAYWLGNSYRKHGILNIFWPDGKKQATEYFCDGFAVGFHQYFDIKEKLAYVIDYTHSDYERQKKIGVWDYRTFYQKTPNWDNPELKRPTQLFREVFAIENGKAIRKSLSIAGTFFSSWIAIDNTSSIDQWTKPGDQGVVKIGNQPWHVVNNNFDYLPFAEVYQSKKQGLASIRAAQSYNSDMLECPWIDEAMQLGLEDPRFKFKLIDSVSEQRITRSAPNLYTACLAKPNADCLFGQLYETLQFATDDDRAFANRFALTSLATGYPEWTHKVMATALDFSFPNPMFAEPASLKAQAEFALGKTQEAEASLDTVFKNITAFNNYSSTNYTPAIAATVPLFILSQKPQPIKKIRDLYAFSENKQVPKSLSIIENFAISLAQQGKIEEALKLADEFFPKENPFVSWQIDSVKAYKQVYESSRHDYLQTLTALIEGRLKREDLSAARQALDEIERLDPAYSQDSALALKIASAYVRLGNIGKALSAIESFDAVYDHQKIADIAVSFCKTGQKSLGI